MSDHFVEEVQKAIVAAINTLGATLVGKDFQPLESSPISDEQIARILRSASACDGEITQLPDFIKIATRIDIPSVVRFWCDDCNGGGDWQSRAGAWEDATAHAELCHPLSVRREHAALPDEWPR